MFEGVHDKIPDITAYLARLGIDGIPQPTKENLDRLIYAHYTHIPYENLMTLYEKKCPDLTISGLFDKIITKKRGGYCFEMNGLFYALLRDLGYDVYPVACRMWIGLGELPLGHEASIVTLDGKKYYVDVGTSGMVGYKSLGFDEVSDNGSYIKFNGDNAEIYKKGEDGDELIISFADHYFNPIDFVPLNFYVAYGPASTDNPVIMVNLTTKTGAYSINGNVFKIHDNGEVTETLIENDEMFLDILKKYFGIVL